MTTFTKETIKNLVKLSRIGCSEEEQEALLADLKQIVGYVELLQEIDVTDVPPCNHVLDDVSNLLRDDVVGETLPRELFLANAPSQIGGMIRVPPVMKGQDSNKSK